MPLETYLIYLAAVGAFFATPPDTSQLLIISNSIRHGLRRSVCTIAGDLTANCLQMTAAAFGLAAIIATSATAFVWIKWIGGAPPVPAGIRRPTMTFSFRPTACRACPAPRLRSARAWSPGTRPPR
jgi:homoserine/homoserine lactone efflux protein